MAIDSRISMMGQMPQLSQAINIFENAMMNSQTRGLRQSQEQRAQALAPFQLQQAQQSVDANQQSLNDDSENRIIRSVAEFGVKLKPLLESGNTDAAQAMLTERMIDLTSKELPTNETVDAITSLRKGDVQGVLSSINTAQQIARQRGLTGTSQKSVGQRDFEVKVNLVKNDPDLKTAEAKAAAIDLGLEARASMSASERIAKTQGLTDKVAASEAQIAGAKSGSTETEKSKVQLKFKPKINKAVKLAEKEAIERGDVLTDLGRMEASLPGVKEVVNELLELSDIATSTLGGKAFDFVVKQSGFGSTKGATAKAKMEAIVDNQVLPLLKETFGAAFTATEGESLKASLVDPDSSPAQRKAQLDAFLAQKERNVRTKQNQVNQTFEFDAQGNLIQ